MSINKRYNGWINCTQKKSECRKKVIKVFLEWAYVFTFVLYEIRSLRSVIFYISCMLSAFLGVSKPYLHVKVNCGMFNLYFYIDKKEGSNGSKRKQKKKKRYNLVGNERYYFFQIYKLCYNVLRGVIWKNTGIIYPHFSIYLKRKNSSKTFMQVHVTKYNIQS